METGETIRTTPGIGPAFPRTVQVVPRLRRASPRHRARLWYEILRSIMDEERTEVAAKITRVQNHVGLPSDRYRAHLQEMKARGLIQYVDCLNSTEEGRAFVIEYEKLLRILAHFNLE
jgi:predicted transcriptional regulator